MKYFVASLIIGFLYYADINAQAYLKTEYITSSKYRDENKKEVGGKGDMKTIQGGIKVPLSIKMNENNKPTAWAVALSGSYASMNNKDLSKDLCLREMLNAQVGLIHMRPLNDKWSMMAILGAGWYTSDLKKILGKSILGQGGILFIRHAKPYMDWGVGVALNNALGYLMIFPSFYFDWRMEGKYQLKVSMYNTFEISASMKMNDNFKLSLVGEANGMSAVVDRNEESMIFVNQYGYVGLQPEFIISKSFSIPITAGISIKRDAYCQKRTIKSIFESKDVYPHFDLAAYCSVGIKYGF